MEVKCRSVQTITLVNYDNKITFNTDDRKVQFGQRFYFST